MHSCGLTGITDVLCNDFSDLERDGFDVNPPCFQCLVAEVHPNNEGSSSESEKKIVGYALYFYAYAAWEGKTIHLEDLCVSANVRGGGIGKKLIKQLAKVNMITPK